MFTLDNIIDSVQNTKKQVVNAFVKNEAVADALNSFVDAQTAYTRSAVKAGTDAACSIQREVVGQISEQFGKFIARTVSASTTDWNKMFIWPAK